VRARGEGRFVEVLATQESAARVFGLRRNRPDAPGSALSFLLDRGQEGRSAGEAAVPGLWRRDRPRLDQVPGVLCRTSSQARTNVLGLRGPCSQKAARCRRCANIETNARKQKAAA
jgi:hypothetical protein